MHTRIYFKNNYMASYPTIGTYVAPPTYSYKPPEVKFVQEEAASEPEQVLVQNVTKAHPMALLAEELEHPSQSVPFLELFEKSEKKVENLGNSLQKASIGLGIVGVVCFSVACVSFLGSSVQAISQSSAMMGNKKLQAGSGEFDDFLTAGNLNISAISNAFSMFMWGLVMAKAKTGFSAAASKDVSAVQSTIGKMIGLGALICVAGVAKLNADNHYVENFVSSVKTQGANMGINLMSTQVQADANVESPLASYENIMKQLK